jgi:hypothetical protein
MVIKPVSDALDITEACFQSFCDGGCALYTEAAGDFSGAEHVLLARIQTAADIIGKTPPADSPADNGKIKLPENPEVYKLALKIKRELPKGGTKEDIALDFTNGDEKKAASLLRQLRPDRYGHLLD